MGNEEVNQGPNFNFSFPRLSGVESMAPTLYFTQ